MYRVRVKAGENQECDIPAVPYLAICIVMSGQATVTVSNESGAFGEGFSQEHALDTFSTWYIAPGSRLKFRATGDQAFDCFVAAPRA